MDKIYTAKDIETVIAKVEQLTVVNSQIEELLYRGSNDEKLVVEKRELQKSLRKYKTAVFVSEEPELEEPMDIETGLMKFQFDCIVERLKERKARLQTEIKSYKNGNQD
jgi:hypothetical protein